MSNAITPAANVAAPTDSTKTTQSTSSDGFSSAFSGVMQNAQRNTDSDSADANDKSTTQTASSDVSATAVALLGPDGNPLPGTLPQVAWSGTVAAGDNQSATALALAGDATTAAMIAPVNAADISTAVQNALRQPLNNPITLSSATAADPTSVMEPAGNRAVNVFSTALTGQNNPLDMLSPMANPTASLSDTAMQSMLTGGESKLDFASMLNQAGMNSPAATPTTALATTLAPTLSYIQTARADQPMGTLPLPINHANWGDQLGEGVRWMVGQHMQQADLRLNPPELGLLEVRIQMNSSDHASLTFCSPHSAVRDAVEHAMPRLRDMLAETGVQLGDVNVSQQSLSQHHANPERFAQQSHGNNQAREEQSDHAEINAIPSVQLPRHGQGLVDIYA